MDVNGLWPAVQPQASYTASLSLHVLVLTRSNDVNPMGLASKLIDRMCRVKQTGARLFGSTITFCASVSSFIK